MPSKKLTERQKRNACKYADEHGLKAAAKKYKVTPSTIAKWRSKFAPGSRSKETRTETGQFKPGVSGNPSGISSAEQRARRLAAEVACKGLGQYGRWLDAEAKKPIEGVDIQTVRALTKDAAAIGVAERQEVTGAQGGSFVVQIGKPNG